MTLLPSDAVPQDEQALWPHVEQQVGNAEVWDEAMLLPEHLVVRPCGEVRVLAEIFLGVDAFAEVGLPRFGGLFIAVGPANVGLQVYQLAHRVAKGFVEIIEERVFLFVERAQVVLVIVEVRAGPVSRLQGCPVQVPPPPVVGDTDVFHEAFGRGRLFRGDGQGLRAFCRGDDAAVAVRLLGVMVMLFHIDMRVFVQFGVVLHWREVGGTEAG